MKAIAVSFSVVVLFGTALTGTAWAQADGGMMELPPLPGETAPASPPAPPAPMDPAMEMDADMEFPPLPEDAVVGNEVSPAPSDPALPPFPGEAMGAGEPDVEMAQPQEVEPLQPLDLSEEPADNPIEANIDVDMEAKMVAPTPPASPSAPVAAVPAPPAPPAPAAPIAAQDAPQENDDFFSDLFGEEGQETEQAAGEPEEVLEPDVVEEMQEPAQQMRPAPRLRREAKDYRLPSKIYKKEYDTDNRHLPVARYEQEYDQQLFLAAAHDRVDVIRGFLDQQGRLPNMRNEVGDTVLLYAVRNGSQNTVRMLLGRGADANAVNDAGVSALQYALLTERADITEALLEKNANPNMADYQGVTPLMVAATKANPIFAQQLLQRGADVNATLRSGRTAAHLAASKNNAHTLAALIEGGASVYATDAKGFTPLMMAARAGANQAAGVLLNAGADAAGRDHLGRTAVDFARMNNNQALVSQIMAYDLQERQPWLRSWEGAANARRPQNPSSM